MRNAMMRMLGVAALVGSTGCLPTYEPGSAAPKTDPNLEESGPPKDKQTSGDPLAVRPVAPQDQTSVYQDQGDPATLAARAADEGALDVGSRRHSCMKMKYETMGRMLATRGVNMGTLPVTIATNCMAAPFGTVGNIGQRTQSARYVYCDSRLTLGYPQYAGRLSEATALTTASATKQADLYVSSAAEIITDANPNGILNVDACKVNGQAAQLFNADNTCNEGGITCVQGYQATPDQLALCNRLVSQADVTPANAGQGTAAVTAVMTGKRLAVAAIMTAAHACE
jgi:hypothetical protein